MSAAWEVQKALYDAMVADTTLTTLVSNRIYDEPPTDVQYPYIVIGDMTEIPDNRHRLLGYDVTHTIHIYTQPYGLGFYPATKILERLNVVLNMKRFNLSSFNMLVCKLDNAINERDGDKRIISARY
jgi:hypothetical protein